MCTLSVGMITEGYWLVVGGGVRPVLVGEASRGKRIASIRFSCPFRRTLWPRPYTMTRAQGALYRLELIGQNVKKKKY